MTLPDPEPQKLYDDPRSAPSEWAPEERDYSWLLIAATLIALVIYAAWSAHAQGITYTPSPELTPYANRPQHVPPAPSDFPPIPPDTRIAILRVEKHKAQTETTIQQIREKYDRGFDHEAGPLLASVERDEHEISTLKADAIKNAGLDPAKYDVDDDRGLMIPKVAK